MIQTVFDLVLIAVVFYLLASMAIGVDRKSSLIVSGVAVIIAVIFGIRI